MTGGRAFAEWVNRGDLAVRVGRAVSRYDLRLADLVRLALVHVPDGDHLWTRPAPSANVPGSATASDVARALQACGRGADADAATGRTPEARLVVPAGAGLDVRGAS